MRIILTTNFVKVAGSWQTEPGYNGQLSGPGATSNIGVQGDTGLPTEDNVKNRYRKRKKKNGK